MTWTRWLLLTPLVLAACSGGDDDTIGVASLEDEAAAAADEPDDAADGEANGANGANGTDDADGSPTVEDTEAQMLEALRVLSLCFIRMGAPDDATATTPASPPEPTSTP